jgi:hypothetical protein
LTLFTKVSSGAADHGADGGAAIFSYHDSTTLQHVTISGNETTGGGGGVYIYQDPNLQAPTSLSIYNSIIANNGGACAGPATLGLLLGGLVGSLLLAKLKQ